MKKVYSQILLGLMACLILTSCLLTREEIKTAEERKKMAGDVELLRKSSADIQTQFDEVNMQQRELVGRIETFERNNTMAAEEGALWKKSQEEKNKIFEESLKTIDIQLKQQQAKILWLEQELNQVKKNSASVSPAPSKKSKGGHYTTAEELFQKKKWKEAILSYEKYREAYPKGRNYSEATYKIGVSFQELGLHTEAKVFFDEVVTKFKKTKAAKKAKVRLGQLKIK